MSRESYRRLVAATPWLVRAPDRVRGQAAALIAAALNAGASLSALEAGLDLISDDQDPDQPGWLRAGVPEHERVTGLECRRVRQAVTAVRTSRRTGVCPCCRAELGSGDAHTAGCPDPTPPETFGVAAATDAHAPSGYRLPASATDPHTPAADGHRETGPPARVPDRRNEEASGRTGPPEDIAAIVGCLERYIGGVNRPPTQTLTRALHRLKSQTAPTDHDLIDWAGYWLLSELSRTQHAS